MSLFAGIFCVAVIYQRVERGEVGEEKLIMLISLSCLMTGIFLIVAFARYQFTHLWLKQRPKKTAKNVTVPLLKVYSIKQTFSL